MIFMPENINCPIKPAKITKLILTSLLETFEKCFRQTTLADSSTRKAKISLQLAKHANSVKKRKQKG